MKNQHITSGPTWHQLDPDVGGYMSAHIGRGQSLIVLTTPISTASQAEHRKILQNKIVSLKQPKS